MCIIAAMNLCGCGKQAIVTQTQVEEQVEQEDKAAQPENTIEVEVQNQETVLTQEQPYSSQEDTSEQPKEENIQETTETSKEAIEVEEEATVCEEWDKEADRVKVKGIYISGPIAGNKRMDELISLVEETELNAVVIDIKNDEGRVTYKMETPMVTEIDSSIGYIPDIDALVAKCKEKNIYLIARIVAFKDPILADRRPDLAIHKTDGSVYRDKKNLAWVNPYEKEVWEYLKEIGIEAANKGFDEIQYDYIRFSTDLSSKYLDFGPQAEGKSKTDIITDFTKYICEELEPYRVFVAADVYGTIIDNKIDQDIVGQNYVEMASYLDYICPMVYPSHYGNGVYGIPIPDAEPYRTVKSAMSAAARELEVLGDGHKAINRVWIQSFTATWVNGHISYGPQQIRDQINGALDAGFDEWILWNAAMKYQKDSLLPAEAEQETQQQQKGRNYGAKFIFMCNSNW